MTTRSADAMIGVVLADKYRVESVVGEGWGGGVVYRAREEGVGPPVIVAVRCPAVPKALSNEERERALQTFLEQAQLLSRVCAASPSCEQLLAFGIWDGPNALRVPFCVFEWLEGRSFDTYLRERSGSSPSIGEAMSILEPAARALMSAHALGVPHGDVRPANLWLADVDGRTKIKLTQLVLASQLAPTTAARRFDPRYGAPEHFKASYGPIGPATDVYGLALSLVAVVTGKSPFEGTEDDAELYLATSDLMRRPTLRARGAQVSDAVEAVVSRALAVDPKRRFANVRELWDALLAANPELTPASPSVRPPRAEDARLGDSILPPAPPSRASFRPKGHSQRASPRRGRLVAILVAVAVLGGLAVVLARLARQPSHDGPSHERQSVVPSAEARTTRDLSIDSGDLPDARAASTPPITSASASSADSESEGAVHLQPFLTDMVRVPAGEFSMGSDHDGPGDQPVHRVKITKAFYIDRTEVTAEAYGTCVEEGVCTPNTVHQGALIEAEWGCNRTKDKPKYPANCVDRYQAEKYCAFASKRLPTEAEWEYAARGTEKRDYPWGNSLPTTCAFAIVAGVTGPCANRVGTWEVGTAVEGKSAFGALDMAGNVWEWTADGYEPYTSAPATDPKVPIQPGGRVIMRGGSWDYSVLSAKATYRLPFVPANANGSTGFRCARDATE